MSVPWELDPVSVVNPWAPQESDALPRPLTGLVGRERLSATVADRLRDGEVRLLTLTGPGGIGKTRLALDAAAALDTAFPDGVFFVALAPLVEPSLVLPSIARRLGVPSSGPQPLTERLGRLLKGRQVLVVLDNFEQVAPAADAVARVLTVCPGLKFLVTSRVPLRVSGEHEFAVPPLDLPASDDVTAEELRSNPAVTLFAQRAQAVLSGFTLDDSTIQTVAALCRRLGGVPLAIELAATRVKVLPPDQILARLGTSLDVLSGGPRDQPARMRSMRATIAWSYDLLLPHQQTLFRWLAIFAGGCPLDAAEATGRKACDGDASVSESMLDVISALIDASLIWQVSGPDGTPRLSMLETIRQFALEKLKAGTDHAAAQAWLVSWCTDLAGCAEAAFRGQGPGVWDTRLQQERDNFHAALAILEGQGDHDDVLRLSTLLAPLWSALGNEREGHRWLTGALAHAADAPAEDRIRALTVTAHLANALGDLQEAESLVAQGQALARVVNDERGLADMQCARGNIARGLGEGAEARARYESALAGYRMLGDQYNIGYTLIQLAKLGDLGTVGRPGDPADLSRALESCEEALQIYRSLGNTWGIARALHQLGHLAYKRQDYARAAQLSSEALEEFWTHGNLTEAANPLEDLADVAGATAHATTAARLYGLAESLRERLGVPMWPAYRAEYDREVDIARNALSADQFQAAWREGRSLTVEAAVAEAKSLAEALASGTDSADSAKEPRATHRLHGLTARELDVLRLLAAGNSNRAIADALFISVTTVKWHVRSIMDKLDLRSRTAIAAWAHRHDLA